MQTTKKTNTAKVAPKSQKQENQIVADLTTFAAKLEKQAVTFTDSKGNVYLLTSKDGKEVKAINTNTGFSLNTPALAELLNEMANPSRAPINKENYKLQPVQLFDEKDLIDIETDIADSVDFSYRYNGTDKNGNALLKQNNVSIFKSKGGTYGMLLQVLIINPFTKQADDNLAPKFYLFDDICNSMLYQAENAGYSDELYELLELKPATDKDGEFHYNLDLNIRTKTGSTGGKYFMKLDKGEQENQELRKEVKSKLQFSRFKNF